MMRAPIKFCNKCGREVVSEVPDGDNRARLVCKHCRAVHYVNPLIVAGCVAVYEDSVLLCKRAIEPRSGYWTVPAGFMEIGESVSEAAARETWEEACAKVELGALTTVVDVIQARQVHIFFEGSMTEPVFAAGDETLEARLFRPEEIPWDEIAFPSVRIALKHHFDSRGNSFRPVHVETAPDSPLD
jgi:ADP-ribose pyrophosphatase YjhB (NUDIX family)